MIITFNFTTGQIQFGFRKYSQPNKNDSPKVDPIKVVTHNFGVIFILFSGAAKSWTPYKVGQVTRLK